MAEPHRTAVSGPTPEHSAASVMEALQRAIRSADDQALVAAAFMVAVDSTAAAAADDGNFVQSKIRANARLER